VRGKTIILVAMLIFLVYGISIVYAQNAYPGYDKPYNPLIGGIQIVIVRVEKDGYTYAKAIASLAFPVKFIEYGIERLGFITAGHAIEVGGGGRDKVYQPTWASNNYIGIGIRISFPYNGGNSDLDAALIRLENRGYEAFIFENGTYYRQGDYPDRNNRVGITGHITPTKDMEKTRIVYKSGRTTGVTYGRIEKIDYNFTPRPNIAIYPTILITRCPDNQCYYNGRITDFGDSGGVVYIRYDIYSERIDGFRVYDYGARVIGIVNGVDRQTYTYLAASWAVKVKDKWPELNISFVTCGPDYSSSCR
jgi:hypothetical protein